MGSRSHPSLKLVTRERRQEASSDKQRGALAREAGSVGMHALCPILKHLGPGTTGHLQSELQALFPSHVHSHVQEKVRLGETRLINTV